MGRKLGLVFFFVVMAVPLFATPTHALDLFPDVDLIPDPNLEDLDDIPDLGPGYGRGGGKHRPDTDGDGIPNRRDLNPSAFGGAEDDTRFHRRHRDDDGDPDEDQYADRDQYADPSQYEARTGGESDPPRRADGSDGPKNADAEREPARDEKVDAEPASAGDDGGGWLGTAVGVFVVLWLLGAVFGR